jgi:hypothetical protein
MSLWVVNHLSLPWLVAFLVVGTTLASMGGCLLVRRLFPSLADGDHSEVAGVVMGIFGAIYGIVLAFVIVALWENYQSADALASTESTSLAAMARAVRAFPPEIEFHLRESIQGYVRSVVEDEWVTMKTGEKSPRTAASIDNLYASLQAYEPQSPSESAFYDQAVAALTDVTSTRRARIQQSGETLPTLFQVLVVGGAVIVIGLTYFLDVPSRRIHLLFVGTVSSLVGFSLLLAMLMDHPFAGAMAVGTGPYKEEALKQFWAVTEGVGLEHREAANLTADEMVGVWNAEDFGVVVFHNEGGVIRASYRYDDGTITGSLVDGLFVGWWCEAPDRTPPKQGGDVEFRLVETPNGPMLDGRWRYGTEEDFKESWDLLRVELPEPADLTERFTDPTAFCAHP